MKSRSRNIVRIVGSLLLSAVVGAFIVSGANSEESGAPSRSELKNAVDNLGIKSTKAWPSEYGGVWYIKTGDPYGGVQVGFTDGAEEKVAELAKDFPEADLLKAITVPASQEEITRTMRIVIADRELAKDGRGPLVEVDKGMFDMDADLKTGEIIVMMPKIEEKDKRIFEGTYPFKFKFEESSLGQFGSCVSREDCNGPIRAGVQSRNSVTPYAKKRCSTGFVVEVASGQHQVLSAAHCSIPANRNSLPNPYEKRWNGPINTAFGQVVRNKLAGPVDAERIQPINSFLATNGWVYRVDTDKEYPVEFQGYWSGVPINETLCRAGNTTEDSCGTVERKNFSPTNFIIGAEKYVMTDACSGMGDSGGAWFRQTKAWGIHAGWKDSDDVPDCSGEPMLSYFGVINFALDEMNATLVTYP